MGHIDQGSEKWGALEWNLERDPLPIYSFVISLGAGKIGWETRKDGRDGGKLEITWCC